MTEKQKSEKYMDKLLRERNPIYCGLTSLSGRMDMHIRDIRKNENSCGSTIEILEWYAIQLDEMIRLMENIEYINDLKRGVKND